MPGTVLDKDNEGTGITSVQANTAGNQYDKPKINLIGGTLRINSTAGKNSGNGPARTTRRTPCSCTSTPAAPTSRCRAASWAR